MSVDSRIPAHAEMLEQSQQLFLYPFNLQEYVCRRTLRYDMGKGLQLYLVIQQVQVDEVVVYLTRLLTVVPAA